MASKFRVVHFDHMADQLNSLKAIGSQIMREEMRRFGSQVENLTRSLRYGRAWYEKPFVGWAAAVVFALCALVVLCLYVWRTNGMA